MLDLSSDVLAALEESHTPGWEVQSFYGSDLTCPAVPVHTDGSLSFDADGQIKARGSLFLTRDGASMVPKSMTDPLASFGQEVTITRTISQSGELIASIPMGRFRITKLPDTKEYFRRFPSRDPGNPDNDMRLVVGWSAQIDFQDRFEPIIADDFMVADAPPTGATCYSELRRISPFPIIETLPDKPVPAGITYSSRIAAIKLLINTLGGEPGFTRQGALTARPLNSWMTATETMFEINGTVSMDDSMSNEIRNQVALKSSVGGNDLVAYASITDMSDPRAVGRMGGRTYRDTLPLDTQAALDAAAWTTLERVSTRLAKTVRFTCLPRPELDLGDFGVVRDPQSGREVVGEISKLSFSMDPTALMSGELVAAETR